MERIEWKGDFLGFTLDGVHSSSLGIVRTSDGSRYDENLLPEFEDKTVKVPGRDETYYFGSEYKQRIFEVKIAFDNMTDKQFRRLRQLMSGQELKDLIFDEAPYKVYKVKANGTPSLSYIAFDEEYRRIYKGEGTLNFIAYFPFARSRFKYREDYTPKNIPEWGGIHDNKMSWLEASNIPSKKEKYIAQRETIIDEDGGSHSYEEEEIGVNSISERDGHIIILKNPGDRESFIKLRLQNNTSSNFGNYKISLKQVTDNDYQNPKELEKLFLNISETSGYYIIDSYNHFIRYRFSSRKDIISNDSIISGTFFNIPTTSDNEYFYIEIVPQNWKKENEEWVAIDNLKIYKLEEYNYLYY